jgi:predicted peroxiredoxin
MNDDSQQKHVIVLTAGMEDGGARATLAMALAVSLQAMGCDVAVYMNFQAAIWALRNATSSIHIRGFDSLETYIDLFQESGGKIYVCTSCIEHLPLWSGREGASDFSSPLRDSVIPAGVTTLASLLAERRSVSL